MFVLYDTFNKGKGVLTTKKIKKGEFIGWYEGELIKFSSNHEYQIGRKDYMSKYNFKSKYGLIYVKEPYHFTHYINDAMIDNDFFKSIRAFNVEFQVRRRFNSIKHFSYLWPCYVATRDIEPGEPLETFYGLGYWLNTNYYDTSFIKLFAYHTAIISSKYISQEEKKNFYGI